MSTSQPPFFVFTYNIPPINIHNIVSRRRAKPPFDSIKHECSTAFFFCSESFVCSLFCIEEENTSESTLKILDYMLCYYYIQNTEHSDTNILSCTKWEHKKRKGDSQTNNIKRNTKQQNSKRIENCREFHTYMRKNWNYI